MLHKIKHIIAFFFMVLAGSFAGPGYGQSSDQEGVSISTTESASDETEAWQLVDKGDLTAVCKFLRKYTDGNFKSEAENVFDELEEKLWDSIKRSEDRKDFEGYKRKVKRCAAYAKHFGNVQKKLNEFSEKETSATEWERFDPNASEEDMAEFISTSRHDVNKKTAISVVRDKFPKLEVTVDNLKKGTKIQATVQNPFFQPRYKDISLVGGLEIDDSAWSEDFILNIEIKKIEENYKILFRDKIGREAIIPFGSTFEVDMEVTDSSYLFRMLGVETPFHVELFNTETQDRRKFIYYRDTSVLFKKELLNNGLLGEYAVKVGYGIDNRGIMELDQSIYLEQDRPFKVWITGFLIAAIIIIGIFLILLFTRKKPEEPVRFHK